MVVLHADAIAENGAAGVGTGRVDGDDAQRLFLFSIEARELIDERALPRSRRAGKTQYAGLAAEREKSFQQFGRLRAADFDNADGTNPDSRVAGAQALYPGLDMV